MIYTVTFSPSIDYFVKLDAFEVNKINRSKSDFFCPGGKGINVSLILNNLGCKSVCLGFVGGFTGKYIEENLNRKGIETSFIHIEGNSRINVKINDLKYETALDGTNPCLKESDIDELVNQLSRLNKGDLVSFNGRFPKIVSQRRIEEIFSLLNKKEIEFIIDTSSPHLEQILKCKPLLIKPNKEELEEVFSKKIDSSKELVDKLKELVSRGVKNAICSLDKDGAILVNKDEVIILDSFKGKVIKTVGCGDSLVGGFIYKYLESKDVKEAFKYGVSAGCASAFSTSLATREEIEKLYRQL